jgi:hypothetical protein
MYAGQALFVTPSSAAAKQQQQATRCPCGGSRDLMVIPFKSNVG